MISEDRKRELFHASVEEAKKARGVPLEVHFDLHRLMCVVSGLQLALRHPGYTGPSCDVVREAVDYLIGMVAQYGFQATAEMLRLGNDPENDTA